MRGRSRACDRGAAAPRHDRPAALAGQRFRRRVTSCCRAGCIGSLTPTACRRAISGSASVSARAPGRRGSTSTRPEFLLNLLHRQTGVGRDGHRRHDYRRRAMANAALAAALERREAERRATWLQFCPLCLAEDETPYFRRRLAARQRHDLSSPRPALCWIVAPPAATGSRRSSRARCCRNIVAPDCGFDLRDAGTAAWRKRRDEVRS